MDIVILTVESWQSYSAPFSRLYFPIQQTSSASVGIVLYIFPSYLLITNFLINKTTFGRQKNFGPFLFQMLLIFEIISYVYLVIQFKFRLTVSILLLATWLILILFFCFWFLSFFHSPLIFIVSSLSYNFLYITIIFLSFPSLFIHILNVFVRFSVFPHLIVLSSSCYFIHIFDIFCHLLSPFDGLWFIFDLTFIFWTFVDTELIVQEIIV